LKKTILRTRNLCTRVSQIHGASAERKEGVRKGEPRRILELLLNLWIEAKKTKRI